MQAQPLANTHSEWCFRSMFRNLRTAVRARLAKRLNAPSIPASLERLLANGFSPTIIHDVGAYRGDFARECLRIWPESQVHCFEVLPDRVAEIKRLSDQRIIVHEYLLGETTKVCELHELETASSVLLEHNNANVPVTRSYPMKTVDEIGITPDLLKLDVQGYEYQVLQGAKATLPGVSVILAEVNLIDIHRECHLLDELIGYLREFDFMTYDICGLGRRPLDDALWQADFIFVKRESPLRANKRWG
ncbi:FkbM family methyltransferase [Rhodoplanes sp. Z2-YC6860]|uniref:FkbM family methyltransferase n=1 Tax=Rhodoplanes sp. Z2-YC6860 TaxID=674703 RepID=UPI00078D343D|nr:FkbM family methyltransferase [Rhodoplanes sp. Z2-YC6860]AMN43769.1 FkbM family methyltransferase [Rhodoplanes sp. Z2-YC6860]